MRSSSRSGSPTRHPAAITVAAVLALSVLAACSKTTTGSDTPTSPAAPVSTAPTGVSLTEAQNGKTVQADVGETVTLTLPETAGTGYTWQAVTPPDAAILEPESDEVQPAADAVPGAPGEHIWTFKALAVGSALIDLASVPPGEKVSKRYSAYQVTVEVIEPGSD